VRGGREGGGGGRRVKALHGWMSRQEGRREGERGGAGREESETIVYGWMSCTWQWVVGLLTWRWEVGG
jgi:hypothetical protein